MIIGSPTGARKRPRICAYHIDDKATHDDRAGRSARYGDLKFTSKAAQKPQITETLAHVEPICGHADLFYIKFKLQKALKRSYYFIVKLCYQR
jgi:hypothetical protein